MKVSGLEVSEVVKKVSETVPIPFSRDYFSSHLTSETYFDFLSDKKLKECTTIVQNSLTVGNEGNRNVNDEG